MTRSVGSTGIIETDTGFGPFSFLEILQTPACILDDTGNIQYLNDAWREYAGLSDIRVKCPSWSDLLSMEDLPAIVLQLQASIMKRTGTGFECRLQDSRGTMRWFLLSVLPVDRHLAGQNGWLCIGTDIHQLKLSAIALQQRESIQASMLNVSVDCIKLIALDGTLIHMNRAGCKALGVAEDSSFGMPWIPLLPEDVWEAGDQALATAKTGAFARFRGRSLLPGQKPQYWDNMLTPLTNAQAEATAILCVSREITTEHEALAMLQESQERLTMAARVGGLGIWDYDIQNDHLHCDETWHRIMGRDPTSPIRSIAEFRTLIHPDDMDRATEVTQTAAELIAAKRDYAIVFRVVHSNGDIRWVRSAACLQETSGIPTRAVGFVIDITDTRQAELALYDANRSLEEERTTFARQSLEDPLTGIANRRHLDSELARLSRHAGETGEAICVGMVDVDHFKAYNDRYGHLEGDIALCKVVSALQSVLRKSDFVARYGGEEFAFILVGMDDPAPLLDRLVAAVVEMAIPHEHSPAGYLSISCGCMIFKSSEGFSPQQLLKLSDGALYEAKATGRNRHVIRSASA